MLTRDVQTADPYRSAEAVWLALAGIESWCAWPPDLISVSASILCPAAEAAEFNSIATMEKKNGLLAIDGPKSEWICTEKLAC